MAYAAKELLCYCRSDKIGEHNIVGCGILLLDAYGESLLQVSQRLLAHALVVALRGEGKVEHAAV